ncbi:uncharacterized protein LOC109707950 isoform X3 [Ananas comosus]|uniref:Uncharacterized protein LOC109707950 isoform X3 n=1 Tax=Ananas comosus TaxID=4615 RepID=A0A199VSN3_ANACO|nr:uncharacterized protein LOC109707950 isoform X3 [Ananas comosus]OAY80222.1 hypothetical protein ACMD2_09687 [Ananas comosus]
MAANSKGRAIAGSFGKRFVNQIWASRNPSPIAVSAASDSRRAVYSSSYDKNVEEDLVHPVVVPDHVIETCESEKYWGPHPTTGVFGPAAAATATAGTKDGPGNAAAVAAGDGGGSTVLDQEVWFRPLEDVDKPPHQPGLN